MNKYETSWSPGKWLNTIKEKEVKTILQFYYRIARLIVCAMPVPIGVGVLAKAYWVIGVWICGILVILLIILFIILHLAHNKPELITEKRISQTPRKNKLSTTESKIETLDNKIKEQDQDDKKIRTSRKQQTKSQFGFIYQVFI